MKLNFIILAFALSACAKSQYINSAQISTHVSNGDEFAALVTNINSSALALPSLQLPIVDLRNPSINFGSISIAPSLDSKSTDLTIDVDLTQALKIPKLGQNISLPNGTPLPISGIDLTQTMEFSIGGGGSKVYLEIDPVNKKAFVGTALVIGQFNPGVPADLFIPFSSNSISGTAGIFTGIAAGQSGLGIFADMSSILRSVTGAQKLALLAPRAVITPHQFLEVNPSNRNQIKIQNMLIRLSSEKQVLDVR